MFTFLFKKKKFDSGGSLYYLSWLKFRKEKMAMTSLLFIILSVLISISGFLISPDSTPNSNDQHLELATQKPGFSVKMLLIQKNEIPEHKNFFSKMLFGEKSSFSSVPIIDYKFAEENIIVKGFFVIKEEALEKKYNIADVVYPLAYNKPIVSDSLGNLVFTDIYNQKHTESILSLRDKIAENHVKNNSFLFGTDVYGRDMLSRLLIGTRVSLSVGFISVFISLIIGIALGLMAGYYRGWIDDFIMWFINVIWSIPTLLLVIAITLVLGKGFWQIFIAVGLTMWVEVARVVRGQALSLREKEFIEAAKALGFKTHRILFRHILPNVLGPVIIISAANFASAILIEAGLSFLGVGVAPPTPSWGTMIKDHYGYIIVDSAYLAILPGVAIMLMVLAFTLVGDGLRNALDTKAAR
ncbi:MAG: ABC transporter permease [Bacteroidia bacterium]|nr:ABC transporter permease [Bacteroidia bacterium]